MAIRLSDRFTTGRLLRFTLPSVAMMIFTSVYGVVDGFFVSNYVGKTPFAALNLIWPFLMLLGAVGFMFGAGGSALVSKCMGEGRDDRANRLFSLFVWTTLAAGVAFAVLGCAVMRPVSLLLGADDAMLEHCVRYGRILALGLPVFMLQQEFQSFFVAAEKPQLGFFVTVFAGITNMALDWLFVARLGWGLPGAAGATVLSQTVGGVLPLLYFARPNRGRLRLCKPRFEGRALLRACANGSSELMSNISMSLVSMLYNFQLMRYAGEDGVSAYGVLMYVNFVFVSAFLGYAVGVSPIVSYNYGAGNRAELKSLLRKSLFLLSVSSVAMFAAAQLLAGPLSRLFVGYDAGLLAMTRRAFAVFAFSFLFSGVAIYGSAFFTSLNNGLVSAVLSFLRTLVFQVAAVLLLPLLLDLDGIWLSSVAAESLAVVATFVCLALCRGKYGY